MASRRYVAFLRGVSPMNAKMPEVKKCFEEAGFTEVSTLLSSGNVIFSAREDREEAIARKAEQAMGNALGRSFATIVRSVDALRAMLKSDPFAAFRLPSGAKKVVTFLRDEPKRLSLPIELDGASILACKEREVFTAYVRSPRGPVFMTLLQKTFGESITTRTWDTVQKAAADHGSAKVGPSSGAAGPAKKPAARAPRTKMAKREPSARKAR